MLEEDGRPQTIRYFSRESNLPLTMGLLVEYEPQPVACSGAGTQSELRLSRSYAARRRPGFRGQLRYRCR